MAGIDLSFGGTRFPRALEVRQHLYDSGTAGCDETRYAVLDRREAFYRGREYDHLDKDWSGQNADQLETISPESIRLQPGMVQPELAGVETPVRLRRPTAPLRLTPLVVDRFTGLLFGRDRTPEVAVEGDDEAAEWLLAVWKRSRFWRTMYGARTFGGSMGSALVSVSLREGRFTYKAHNPKTVADIAWSDDDATVPVGVLIQYAYEVPIEEKGENGEKTTRREKYVYRRIIDDEMDILFVPAPMQGNEIPLLEVDLERSYRHGLGRFPGAWVQNLPNDEGVDGIPDCDGAYQMFDTVDRQISQSNKGLLANQDPTIVVARDPKLEQFGVPLKKGSDNALNVGLSGSANYLEIGGAGIQAAREFAFKDLKGAALDKCQMVVPDPERIVASAQSGKAIELLYAAPLEKASRLREQYGEAVETLADVTLGLGRLWSDPLQYRGRARVSFDLPPKIVERDPDPTDPDAETVKELVPLSPGVGGVVSLSWGAFFEQTPNDIQTEMQTVAAAYGAGLIDRETAIRKTAPLLDVEDIEGLLRRVLEEAEKKAAAPEIPGMFGQEVPLPSGEVPPDEEGGF